MRAAAVQMGSSGDVDANLAAADRLVGRAARDGAELVVLPEKWPALGEGDVVRAGAERAEEVVRWATETARTLGIDLVAGSIALADEGTGRLRNTCLHAGPDGEIHASYTKLHLFDVEVEGRRYAESEHEDAGDEVVVTRTRGGLELGLAICFDLRFPALFEAMGAQGAHAFALPSAFTLPTTRAHWDVLVRARAIEQLAYVIAANQFGEHPGGLRSGGRSAIVDPWGTVLAQAPEEGEAVLVGDLDLAEQRRVRERLPVLGQRSPALSGAGF